MRRIRAGLSWAVLLLMSLSDAAWSASEVDRYGGPEYAFRPDVKQLAWPQGDEVKGAPISIIMGTSQVLRFDRPITRTAISDSGICDIVPLGNDEILVYSKKAGRMNLILWDEDDKVASYDLEATSDTDKLAYLLKNVDAEANFKIVPFQQTVAVYGSTSTKTDRDRIEQVTKAFDPLSLNFVEVKNAKQILLEVRFAEINRRNTDDFKFDLDVISNNFLGRSLTGQTGASELDSVGDNTLTTFPLYSEAEGVQPGIPAMRPNLTVGGSTGVIVSPNVTQSIGNLALSYFSHQNLITPVLNWLETKNVLKIIARPNLIAKDGEEATFLVGGEFGFPVSGSNGALSVEYQEYGTKLTFTPEVLKEGLIRIKVSTEVSELDYANTVRIGSTEIPSVLKREQKTVAELKDNQTLVIGGMLTQRLNRINSKLPILGDIPFLKALFASESFTRTDVELLVVITPHIIDPIQLPEAKSFYNAEAVGKAVRVIEPSYSDPHGDAVHEAIIQDEDKTYFDDRHRSVANGRVPNARAPFTPSDSPLFKEPMKEPIFEEPKAARPENVQPKRERTIDKAVSSNDNRGYLMGSGI